MPHKSSCRGCGAPLQDSFLDLGSSPPSNAYLTADLLDAPEPTFPLHVFVCRACFLVQLPQYLGAGELFTPDYAYFSSFSDSWLKHSQTFVAKAAERLGLGPNSFVVEVASNDGYLLQYVAARGMRARGIEPTHIAAEAARAKNISTDEFFLGEASGATFAQEHGEADLVVANNVLAHVPDLHDFVAGLGRLAGAKGAISIEFPHLLELLRDVQFDTIYHEHFSYFSLLALEPVLEKHSLTVVDVERLSTHGGSLRLWLRASNASLKVEASVPTLREEEQRAGLGNLGAYGSFAEKVHNVKRRFLEFLIQAADAKKRVVAYGAAAKGNTLLNYCGVREDLIEFVVDRNPHKAGKWMPGSRLPIRDPAALVGAKPDFVVIFPWNIKDEVMQQMRSIRDHGGRFVTAIPMLRVEP